MKRIAFFALTATFIAACAHHPARNTASLGDNGMPQPVGQPAMIGPDGHPIGIPTSVSPTDPNHPIGIPTSANDPNHPIGIRGAQQPVQMADMGSGIPPGALGMPAMEDMACRRAAGQKAVSAALDFIHNAQDCSATQVDAVQPWASYTVTVDCREAGTVTYSVPTTKTKSGCQAKKPKRAN